MHSTKLLARMSPSSLLYNACLLIPILSASSVMLTPSLAAIAFTILPISNLITTSLKAAHRLAFSILHETMLHLAYSLQFLRTSYQSISGAVPHLLNAIPTLIPARLIFSFSFLFHSSPLPGFPLLCRSLAIHFLAIHRHNRSFRFNSLSFRYLFYPSTTYCQYFPLISYFYFDTDSVFRETLGRQFGDFGNVVGVTRPLLFALVPCPGVCLASCPP